MKMQADTDLTREDWFRRITREIRGEFHNIDTTVLTKDELYDTLDEIFRRYFRDFSHLLFVLTKRIAQSSSTISSRFLASHAKFL